ncbi:Na+/H+ antiporter NhaC family protein [Adlercreutzia murintestinalis]|uniref:Na+/H+ antiporter NhaC family protein n=1 Tax=Adlercreutzia murintestinalis TaxID=2941325 RepID=UPI00203CF89F|nr:Na+/H+ antiporter NhaC family protein [Adlercreutzia murintestinalis]
MEGFDLIATGFWSVIPPLLALALALITKEVYSSLTIGVFVGMVIYQFTLNGAGAEQLIASFTMVPQMMAEQIAGNGALLLFLALLGALTVVIAVSGGSRAYAEWVSTHIKNAKMATILTAILGIIIFVDDYFNCLTVGAVMRPITDRFHVSHEKLAWIIDSTAAPVCIIAPVSSWAVAVGGYLGEDGFNTFVASIPYNFYALLTIFFVFFMLILGADYSSMRAAEAAARHNKVPAEDALIEEELEAEETKAEHGVLKAVGGNLPADASVLPPKVTERADIEEASVSAIDEYKGLNISEKGKVADLVVPIIVLIIFSILGMLYMGGFFEGVDFATAVGENPVMGLCIGACVGLVCAAIMYLPRKLTTIGGFMDAMSEGVRSMVGAIMILVLAWSLGGVCRYLLGTGEFVSGFLNNLGVGLDLLPAIIFVVAAFIGFAMGTSWGTVALILPIVIGVFDASDPLFLVAVGATLAGAVYGDHISPISDTTILSSAGAKCNHLRHVATQIPYATTVMVVCLVCYIIAGFVRNPWIALGIGLVLLVAVVLALHFFSLRRAREGKAHAE